MSHDEFALASQVPVGGRASHDHYPTPAPVTRALSRHAMAAGWWMAGETVLDPCCGEGAILDVLREDGLQTRGIELDPGRASVARERGHANVLTGDALALWAEPCRIVVTNPPFLLAEEFVRLAMERRPNFGIVVMLLRNTFFESVKRASLHRSYPADVYILPRRPKFNGKGNDSVGVGWWVWGASPGNHWYVLESNDGDGEK
jgi:hypothetical protein